MTLPEFFKVHNRVAVALSGGVDSAYLLYSAKHFGAEVRAYFVDSEFCPSFEYEDAVRVAEFADVPIRKIELRVLENKEVEKNLADRCYHCKKMLLSAIKAAAEADGFETVIEGTNASDDISLRPGFRALSELGIMSPLLICGVTKEEIRRKARKAGLFNFDKPAYACLATRIKTGEKISKSVLLKIESAEAYLQGLGFSDFRVRVEGDTARLSVREADIQRAIDNRVGIVSELKKSFGRIVLDLEARDE